MFGQTHLIFGQALEEIFGQETSPPPPLQRNWSRDPVGAYAYCIYSALLWQKVASDISCKIAKCVCHFHCRQWNIMSYVTYLSIG